MGLFEAVIRALLYICGLVLLYYIIVWVLVAIGLSIPSHVLTIIMVMIALVAVLVLARLFWPWMQNATLFPPRNPPNP